MAVDNIEFNTTLGVSAVDRVFRAAIRNVASGAEIGQIAVSEGRSDDLGSYAQGKTLIHRWCVQMFVRDDGSTRRVQLVVLGGSILGKVWNGTRDSYSLLAGQAKAVAVIDALKIAQRAAG